MLGNQHPYRDRQPASIWQMTYTYDQAGDVWIWTHPAGFTLTNTISNARRITQISVSNADGNHPANMAQNITYTAWGALSSLTNGCAGSGCTNTVETYSYNNRLQPDEIQLGTTSNLSSYYALSYNYSLPGGSQPPGCPVNPSGTSGNNGNVIGYTYADAVNSTLSHSSLLVYDGLNRLTCAQATGNSAYNLTFSYNQDGSGQYGNMTCSYNSNTSGPSVANTFNGATNQINSSGYSYDAAGDVLTDGTYGYTWDAEGRMTSQTGSAVAESSVYNALGQFAEGYYSGGSSSLLYDPSGQWIGQYNSAGYWWGEYVRLGGRVVAFNSQSAGITVFLHKDMQTTTHMATGPDGSVLQDQVFYPWGQSWYNLATWYQQEFAGLDLADPSTGFYNSLSRTYNPPPGRWLSPDPLGLDAADSSDPQTWNMYAYVRNNPATFTDPDGLLSVVPSGCTAVSDNNAEGTSHVECPPSTTSDDDNGLPWSDTILYADAYYHPPSPGDSPASSAGGGASPNSLPENPCAYIGRALPPSAYAGQGKADNGHPVNFLLNVFTGWPAGHFFDPQPLASGTVRQNAAYGNYVFGVYMQAAGVSLSTALAGADAYAFFRSSYGSTTPMDPVLGSLPAANVANIINGYTAQQNGTTCHN